MGLPFRQVRKLWLLYLFLMFFAFFMFALSINIYIQSLYKSDLPTKRNPHFSETSALKRGKTTTTVVGHYVGYGNVDDPLTREELDENAFNPIEGEGAEGAPVLIPPRLSIKMQRAFKIHSYNLMASDRIPLNRTLKDYRIEPCQALQYDVKELPTTSVIIVFHNEAWSVLLRTIWSIINRSPIEVLKEIILVDDASDRKFLGKPLEDYVAELPVPVKIIRQINRQGIVPARLAGAEKAQGDVLTFLDAHCECTVGWLEPQLARVKQNKKAVVCPIIDIISEDTFSFTKVFGKSWGGFDWKLGFKWYATRPQDAEVSSESYPTPTMAGGLFSIDRHFFYHIGAYDDEMKIWGGENIEMSFRVWQCGGSVEIHPCSRVGHVFRKVTPYTFPGGVSNVLTANTARTALVWMDKWTNFVLRYGNLERTIVDSLDVSDRLALRKKLQCKSFDWYLENVWPSHFLPAEDRFFGKILYITNTQLGTPFIERMKQIAEFVQPSNLTAIFSELDVEKHHDIAALFEPHKEGCLRMSQDERSVWHIAAAACLPDPNHHDLFVITPEGQIMGSENFCVDYYEQNMVLSNAKHKKESVRVTRCQPYISRQLWDYKLETQQIVHKDTQLCLTMNDHRVSLKDLIVADCSPTDWRQKWGLLSMPWKT